MKTVDCHCHVYPDFLARRAVSGITDFYNLEPSEDLLSRGSVSDMLRRERVAGIGHTVIFSVATSPHQVASVNSFIAGEVQKSGGTMTGLGTVHPGSPSMAEDIETIISLGLRGIKIHPDFQQTPADDPRYFKVYERCEGRLPVLIHCGDSRKDFSNPGRIDAVLSAFPSLTLIGAHLGGWSVWDEATAVLPRHRNFFVDCSSSFYLLGKERALEIIRAYGADRVLFGTDYPVWNPADEVGSLLSLGLDEDELELVSHLNAERIFGIEKYEII